MQISQLQTQGEYINFSFPLSKNSYNFASSILHFSTSSILRIRKNVSPSPYPLNALSKTIGFILCLLGGLKGHKLLFFNFLGSYFPITLTLPSESLIIGNS